MIQNVLQCARQYVCARVRVVEIDAHAVVVFI